MKLGVIGLGAMGWNHARVAQDMGVLGGIAEPSEDLRRKAKSSYRAPMHATHDSLLRESNVSGVILATPTSTHAALALAALEADKHVLVEKPLAATVEDAQRIIDKAKEKGLTLAVGQIERHNPVVGFAASAVKSRKYGDLLAISSRRLSSFPGRIRDVGCILDIGIHDIDFACALAGSEPTVVFARAGSHRSKPYEDHAFIQIGFRGGATASIETNWLTPMRVRHANLTLTEANMELDFVEQVATISTSQPLEPLAPDLATIPTEYNHQVVTLRRKEPLRNELEDFVAAIQDKRPALVDGAQGLRALRVAHAALESARTGKAVEFSS
jgi:UDP-N-acetylglucosamine 3-dehydrogenase